MSIEELKRLGSDLQISHEQDPYQPSQDHLFSVTQHRQRDAGDSDDGTSEDSNGAIDPEKLLKKYEYVRWHNPYGL